MTRTRPHGWSALLLAGAVACGAGTDLTEPNPRASRPPSFSASVQSGISTFSFDRVHWWGCIGERVHNVFVVTYSYTLVQLPTGEFVYRELWPNGGAVGAVTGLTSGHVWTRDSGPSPYIESSTAGGRTTFTGLVRFVSETGPTIEVREVFHLSRDASGEIRVDEYMASCEAR